MTKKTKIVQLLEAAAKESDRHTRAARETAAKLITQANAVKRGAVVPPYAKVKR